MTFSKSIFAALNGGFRPPRVPAMCQRRTPGHCQCQTNRLSRQSSSHHWFQGRNRGRLHAKRRGLFRVSFPRCTRPPRAKNCLACAREDLQAIASATLTGSLGSQAPNIGFKVETAAEFLPREEDFSESVSRGVHVLQEPRTVWHVLEKTSRPLPVPH